MPKRAQKKILKIIKKTNKKQRLSYIWSKEQSNKEGLYFPMRRVRISYPSKLNILKRIESQNFKGATEQEITDCQEEMARQIKIFKRKFRKIEMLAPQEEAEAQSISFYQTTHEFIQSSWKLVNPHDHKDLLKNLLLIIVNDRLTPDSNGFGKMCSLVREWMPISLIQNISNQRNLGMFIFEIFVLKCFKCSTFEYF